MLSISYFYKVAASRETTREIPPEVQARFNKIMENYLLSSRHPNIKDFDEGYHSLSRSEKRDFANQIEEIDRKVFESKYPKEEFANSYDVIMRSLSLKSKPYGFYMHTMQDPNKICGYIYGSNALNHIDDEEIENFEEINSKLSLSTELSETNEFSIISLLSTSGLKYVFVIC